MTARFLIILCLMGMLAINNTHAQLYLATAADGGSSSNSGNSWNSPLEGSAYLNSKANTALAPAGTTIYMKKGDYNFTPSVANTGTLITNSGISVIGGFPSTATGNDISGYNPLANPTKITIGNAGYLFFNNTGAFTNFKIKGLEFSALANSGVHVLRANGGNSTYTIEDVNIHDMKGAALFLTTAGTVTVTNSIFKDNNWSVSAAGIYLNGSANLTVTNSSFTNNTQNALNSGGAIAGTAASTGTITVDHSSFCNNTSGSYGGAIHKEVGPGGIVLKNGCVFYGNYQQFNGTVSYKAGASVTNDGTSIFSNNTRGGIYYISGSSFILNNNSTASYSCPTSINPVAVNVQGSIWNDADGSVTLNGSETGTNAGGLFVNLVNASGNLVTSASVAPDGTYSLTAPVNTTGLKLVLSTSATATTPGPLPTGWVNTGELAGVGNSATQSATLGQIELSTSTTATLTGQSFGIEQTPTTGSGTATVSNSGGTSGVSIPSSAFTSTSPSTDTAPGSVTAIRITAFPSNVTSLTINGVVYTATSPEFSGATPTGVKVPTDGSGAPSVAILIDPTNDSNPVSLSFVAVDNAGKEATNTGTATINSTLLATVSGSIVDDANGLNDTPTGIVSGTAVNGPSLPVYISLVQAGVVVATGPVQADGTYSLPGVAPGSYSLVITTNPSGSVTPSLPSAWASVGEHLGLGAGSDGNPNGVLPITVSTTITNANFGIDQLPTASPVSQTYVNPGGTNQVQVPTLTGSDPEDGALGSGATFVINSLPASGILYYLGAPVSAGDVISGYDPASFTYDPIDGPGSYTFAYSSVDAAGLASVTATATMSFTAGVPDLAPIIYASPSTQYGTTNFTVVVDVYNLLPAASNGLITVYVTKDPLVALSFNSGSAVVGGRLVDNGIWAFNGTSNTNYYILTTSQVITGGNKKTFGLTGVLTPGNTQGTVTITSAIVGGSGSEVRIDNNSDADKIDYFKK